jgi:hypothetical protein
MFTKSYMQLEICYTMFLFDIIIFPEMICHYFRNNHGKTVKLVASWLYKGNTLRLKAENGGCINCLYYELDFGIAVASVCKIRLYFGVSVYEELQIVSKLQKETLPLSINYS